MRSRDLTGLGTVNGIDLDEHATLILHCAHRVASRTGRKVRSEDLLSSGWYGLRHAAEKFEPSRGYKFSTFAQLRVRGAMLDYLRETDEAPRQMRQREREGARPVPKVVHFSSYSEREWVGLEPESRAVGSPEHEREEVERTAQALFRRLRGRELFIVRAYYLEGSSMGEIATALGVTESRACQMMALIRKRKGWSQRSPLKNGRSRLPQHVERERLFYVPDGSERFDDRCAVPPPKPALPSVPDPRESWRAACLEAAQRRWARTREQLGLAPGEKIPACQAIGRHAVACREAKRALRKKQRAPDSGAPSFVAQQVA